MNASEELLRELRPVCIRFYFDLLQHAFPGIWSGDLTLNQMRVNNSVFTRQLLEGEASTVGQISDDLAIPRTTVNRALEKLKTSSSSGTEGYHEAIIGERRDPDDDRKRLYQLVDGSEQQVEEAMNSFTQLLLNVAMEMLPILRRHGLIHNDNELLAFVKHQIPQLVEQHLQTDTVQSDQVTRSAPRSS